MSVRSANFQDLLRIHYAGTAALPVANSLKTMRSGGIPEYELESFSLEHHISQSSAILFSPVRSLLEFYGLLEIALIGKFIPEPDYMDLFWKDAGQNLDQLLTISPTDADNYPMVLPQFLFGRLQGRMHLEEEGIDVRYNELASILISFFSVACRWRDPDIGAFLRFVLFRHTTGKSFEKFIRLVADRNEFMQRVVRSRLAPEEFADRLLRGFGGTLNLCEDLDRLLQDAKPFPLLQSAMWVYHADLFSTRNGLLREYLMGAAEAFFSWLDEQPLSDDAAATEIYAQRSTAISNYFEVVKQFMDRLSSGEYDTSLRRQLAQPPVPVGV